MNVEDLKDFINNNPTLVKMKDTPNPDLFVLKYSRRVFYDNLWDEFLEECRGTIVDKDFNLVSYPFKKIYNYGIEKNSPIVVDETFVHCFRKVNGFMISCTYHDGELLVSTTGTIDSDFVGYAKELMDVDNYLEVCKDNAGYTFMFECVSTKDPHIIPEKEGMYLLGYRKNEWNSPVEYDAGFLYAYSLRFKCYTAEYNQMPMKVLLKIVKHVKHEGFVGYTDDGAAFKIKSPYYLINKFLARTKKMDVIFSKNFKENVEEESYGIVEYLQENYTKETFLEIPEQGRLQIIRDYYENN